jgi:hypothetical protein
MIHPSTEVRYIDDAKGYGLFATRGIVRGTITWTLDKLDRVLLPEEMESFDERYQEILLKYSFRNNQGSYVFCWDNGRYINHSFDANCCLTPYNFEIAIRDIEAGEEVTDDYGYLNIIEPFEADPEGGSRSVVYPDDLLVFAEVWDKKVQAAFPKISQVAQPLWDFLTDDTVQLVQAVLRGKREMLSIRSCYYEGAKMMGPSV